VNSIPITQSVTAKPIELALLRLKIPRGIPLYAALLEAFEGLGYSLFVLRSHDGLFVVTFDSMISRFSSQADDFHSGGPSKRITQSPDFRESRPLLVGFRIVPIDRCAHR